MESAETFLERLMDEISVKEGSGDMKIGFLA